MAKELPYFKFEPNQWQNGNIQMCSEITQLYFINMCCVYWSKLGNLNDRFALIKCFNNNKDLFNELVENNIINISNNGDITISFLDVQLSEFKIKSKTSAESGRKGGQNNGVRPEIERRIGNQLYLLECWNNEEIFYKLGITSSSISRRYSGKIQYQYKVVFQIFTDDCAKAENEICELLKDYEYKPLLNFAGQKECFLHSENQLIEATINSYFNFAKATLIRNDAIREDKRRLEKIKEEKIIVDIKEIFNFKKSLIDFGFEENLVSEWMLVRKNKKATNTKTTFEKFIKEIQLASEDKNEILKFIIEKDWKSFEYQWLVNLKNEFNKNQEKQNGQSRDSKSNEQIFTEAMQSEVGKNFRFQ